MRAEEDDNINPVVRDAMDIIDRADQKLCDKAYNEVESLLRMAYRTLLMMQCKLNEPERDLNYRDRQWFEDSEPVVY